MSNDKNKSSSGRYLCWAPYQPSGNGNCAKMFMNSYYLGYDDISCDERARGIGCICERANECNDEKGMAREGRAPFITLLISFKYHLNSLQKFGKCSYLKLRYEVFQNTSILVYIENVMGGAAVELYLSYLSRLVDINRWIG